MEALSPSGKLKKCDVAESGGVYTATFTPDEIGKFLKPMLIGNFFLTINPV